MAEEVPAAPQIELSQTTFPAGDWLGGFTVTGSGFDPSVPTAEFGIGASGANGGGMVFSETIDVAEDGTIEAFVVPDEPTQAPDAEGFPIYRAAVSQVVDGEYLNSNQVVITITEGVSLSAAAEATVEQVTAGVAAQYAGFDSAEPIAWGYALWRWTEAEGEQLIDEAFGEGAADANGAGSFSSALEGAQVGDTIQIRVVGDSGRIAEAWVQVVVTPAPAPAPAPAAPAAPAAAPRLPDTGVELGIGFAALALLVAGAGAIVVTRRTRASQQH
jgi:LPXTG-motif cell wall-anchored protein